MSLAPAGIRNVVFDLQPFLSAVNGGKKVMHFSKKETIFGQDDPSDAVFYLRNGKVRINLVSAEGKAAILGVLQEGDFVGAGCLLGEAVRMYSAVAETDSVLIRISAKAMRAAIHSNPEISEKFVNYLLLQNMRYEEALVHRLFDNSEKRLARLLLLLAHFGKDGQAEAIIPKISQETLAEMVGTTRSRVNFFMNRFRKFGFIRYNDHLEIHSSLLNVVLHD